MKAFGLKPVELLALLYRALFLIAVGFIVYQVVDYQTDPYNGWETYCDRYSSFCFKYPKNWTYKFYKYDNVELSYRNTSIWYTSYPAAFNVLYPPYNFYTERISKVPAVNGLSVVGGFSTNDYGTRMPNASLPSPSSSPEYMIVNTNDAKPLALGAISTVNGNGPLGNGPLNDESYFMAGNVEADFSMPSVNMVKPNVASDRAWFSTPTAKTVSEILESLFIKGK